MLGPATPEYSLAIWHGFTLPLLMSVVALVGGVIALRGCCARYLASGATARPLLRRLKGQRIFERRWSSLSWRWRGRLRSLLGTRRLQPQLRLARVRCVARRAVAALRGDGLQAGPLDAVGASTPAFALVWVVGIVCAIGAAYQAKYHRLAALILMGGAGLVTCITFVWLSAPDLALTQLLVEIVTTVLILLGLRWLPKRLEEVGTEAPARWLPGCDARAIWPSPLAAGAGLSTLAYAMMTRPLPDGISRFFLERAYTEGGGTNVVNVILVDFRGFDTLGEITVLGVVALTVYALLRRFRPAPESIDIPSSSASRTRTTPAIPTGKRAIPSPTICWSRP